jgi:formate dehydrogenase major subunit
MTGRTSNGFWRPTDTLDVSPGDALRYGLKSGAKARIVSRYGSAELPVRVSQSMRDGEVFATFHSPDVFLNQVTGPYRDGYTTTPEYKITTVRMEVANDGGV